MQPNNSWRNEDFEFGLLTDQNSKIDNIINTVKYTNDLLNYTNETQYANENTHRLWMWTHLKFIFSTGRIFEQTDKVILDKIITYFDKSAKTFIPCEYVVRNYLDSTIKDIENTYDIDNGNYHIMLVPYIMCSDPNELNNGPEEIYRRIGPIDVYTNIQQITDYIIEINYKYACVVKDLPEITQNYVYSGVPREFGTVEKEYQAKITRKYFDGNSRVVENPDNIEFNNISRSVANKYQREIAGNNIVPNTNRRKGKSLRQRIKEDVMDSRAVIFNMDQRGAHLRMNDYYETNKNRDDKPNYYIYNENDNHELNSQIEGRDDFLNQHL
jgi:hypothetical protein